MLLCGLAVALSFASRAGALEPAPPSEDAPSQELPSDVRTDYPFLGVALDPLGFVFGFYGAAVEIAPHPYHGVWIALGWTQQTNVHGVELQAAYHLYPLGRGLAGLFVGPLAGLTWHPEAPFNRILLALEGGYQHALGPFVLGAAVGADVAWTRLVASSPTLGPRFRLIVGLCTG